MLYVIAAVGFLTLIFGPSLWVKYVLKKYHRHLPNMPGTGGEFAEHLIKRFSLSDVKIEQSEANNDHFSPYENAVRLSPEVFKGKSLSAVAIAAHEVGHAIQHNNKEPVSLLRDKYLGKAAFIKNCGVYILIGMPIITLVSRAPSLGLLTLGIGVITLLCSVAMHLLILPEEWDASFNKALPILKEGNYIPDEYLPAVEQVLKACAFTYVAAALTEILYVWRWLR